MSDDFYEVSTVFPMASVATPPPDPRGSPPQSSSPLPLTETAWTRGVSTNGEQMWQRPPNDMVLVHERFGVTNVDISKYAISDGVIQQVNLGSIMGIHS